MNTGTVKHLASLKWQQRHKSNLTWLQILVYQILVTEQVTDDTEVMTAELKVQMQVADLKLVIELSGHDKGLLDGGNI